MNTIVLLCLFFLLPIMGFGQEKAQATSKPWGVSVSGEFLYWKVNEERLAYGIQSFNRTGDPNRSARGHIERIDPDWHPGFRVGVAYEFPYEEYFLSAKWTRYHADESHSTAVDPQKVFWPFHLDLNDNPIPDSAHAHWNLKFDTLDIIFGTPIQVKKSITLTPYVGPRIVWIDQNFNIDYFNVVTSGVPPTTFSVLHSDNDNHFDGYGGRVGLDVDWGLKWGLSIFGEGALSLLWGQFNLTQTTRTPTADSGRIEDTVRNVSPAAELSGGLAWKKGFQQDRFLLNLSLAWEQSVYFNQYQFNRFLSDSNEGAMMNEVGNLGFSGITAKLRFTF